MCNSGQLFFDCRPQHDPPCQCGHPKSTHRGKLGRGKCTAVHHTDACSCRRFHFASKTLAALAAIIQHQA